MNTLTQIGGLRFAGANGNSWSLQCDAAAATETGLLMLASVVGPNTSVKAVKACLQSDITTDIYPENLGAVRRYRYGKHDGGYDCKLEQVAEGYWQMLAVAKEPRLLPSADPESVWRKLGEMKLTTPRLPQWREWIIEELRERRKLRDFDCFQCHAAALLADTADLDQIVSDGLASSKLAIERCATIGG